MNLRRGQINLQLVVCEVPEARQSVNEKTGSLEEIYSILKHVYTFVQQVDKLDWLLNQSRVDCPVRVSQEMRFRQQLNGKAFC